MKKRADEYKRHASANTGVLEGTQNFILTSILTICSSEWQLDCHMSKIMVLWYN